MIRRRPEYGAAFAVVVVAGLLVTLHPSPGAHRSTEAAVPANCTAPVGPVAAYTQLTTLPLPTDGTVTIAGTRVAAASMFLSHGDAGTGVLCVTEPRTVRDSPLRIVVAPAGSGAFRYLAQSQTGPLGAVPPAVTRVVILLDGQVLRTFTIGGDRDSLLQPIADGWHAFDDPTGHSSSTPGTFTLEAYDARGRLLDTAHLPLAAAEPSGGPR